MAAIRLQAGVESDQPPSRTGKRGGVPAEDDGNPEFLVDPNKVRLLFPNRRCTD